jgi:hypothetical protein
MKPEEFVRHHRGMLGPAWRANLAENMLIQQGTPLAGLADELLVGYGKYRRLSGPDGNGTDRAAARYPLFAEVERLNADTEKTAVLKLMVVADMPREEMQARTGIGINVLQVWEPLFFDARDQRQATSWLAVHVVNREAEAGNPELASRLKMAIMVGLVAVRGMLDMAKGICMDEADRLFQRKLKLNEKMDLAANLSVDNEKNRMFFMKSYIQLIAEEKRLALSEQKLSQRCAEARDRFELSKMRMEQAAEFRSLKLAEKQRLALQREFLAAQQRHAEQELGRYFRESERKAMEHCIAESPLAQLRWPAKVPITPTVVLNIQLECEKIEQMDPKDDMPMTEHTLCSAGMIEEMEDMLRSTCLHAAV